MNVAYTIARLLLGLIFVVFGLNGLLHFMPAPPLTGNVAAFTLVMADSHYAWFVFGVQIIGGVLLMANQYVPFAILVLAPVLANILVFHLTMYPIGFPPALVTTALWIFVASRYRSLFAPLFARKVV